MSLLPRLAGRVPRRLRRAVPVKVRNALVERIGHPVDPFDPNAHPRRANLGCGFDLRPGYLNVDSQGFHSPDLVGDVRELPELPSGFYEEVLAQDVLEHLVRADVPVALREWRRLLAPGGRLHLRVPDLPSLLRWLDRSEQPDDHRRVMHLLFGTQAYDGDYHHTGFTDVLLCDELHRAGFEHVEAERRDDWLWEVDAQARPQDAAQPAVALVWGPGFHALERGGGRTWRWAQRHAELSLHASEPGHAELALGVDTGSARLSGDGVDMALEPGEHVVALDLPAGSTRLALSAAEAADTPGDDRELALRLTRTELSVSVPAAAA